MAKAEKLLTAEEMQVLEKLSKEEQVLTLLCAIGFEEQVEAVLDAKDEKLSEEAAALLEQIRARIAEMDADEYAAFEVLLQECFEQETIEVDGAEYTFYIVEVDVTDGDALTVEYYSFRYEEGSWIRFQL